MRLPHMIQVSPSHYRCALLTAGAATAVACALSVTPVQAQVQAQVPGPVGYTVSVDGAPVAGDMRVVDQTRRTDVDLANSDIQVRYDGLEIRPVLNAMPTEQRRAFRAGDPVTIHLTTNYPQWIERAEIRVFKVGAPLNASPLAVLPVTPNGEVVWTMPDGEDREFVYVARVYDHAGRFDETRAVTLTRTERADPDPESDPDLLAAGFNTDWTRLSAIPLRGGSVTVFGERVSPDAEVRAFGETIPVNPDGAFVIQRILPPGEHRVDVTVDAGEGGQDAAYSRMVDIPVDDWFYVGIADLTLGERSGSGREIAAHPEEFDGVYDRGRLAFYVTGKFGDGYRLTASADTGEVPLENLFDDFLSKDPLAVLRRIDPKEYYPIYGDDSTLIDNAPTRGKLYARLDHDFSHLMWGVFSTQQSHSAFANAERVLYGASGLYRSEEMTPGGQPVATASAYAAQPGALPGRDVLRGTGGSAYFLRRQDLVLGSEVVAIEIRDGITGQLVSRRTLALGDDYRINYMQGLVILTTPLNSRLANTGPVQADIGQDIVNLVVQYEYAPTGEIVSDYDVGGSARVWLNNNVAIGANATADHDGFSNRQITSVDARVQSSETTFVELEVAKAEGRGASGWLSTDGGLTYNEDAPVDAGPGGAYAYRLNTQLDLSDFSSSLSGVVGGYVETREAGFSTTDLQAREDQTVWRVFGGVELSPHAKLNVEYSHFDDAGGRQRAEGNLEYNQVLVPRAWDLAIGLRHLQIEDPGASARYSGDRTDAGLRLTRTVNQDLSVYGYVQSTLQSSDDFEENNRVGVGGDWKITPTLSLGAEVSEGTSGFGALASITHQPTPDSRTYFGYRLNPVYDGQNVNAYDRFGSQRSGLVVGAERRYGDWMQVHAESTRSVFTNQRSVTDTYGVTLTPNEQLTITGGIEIGEVEDPNASSFDRRAISLGGAVKADGVEASLRWEGRHESSADGTRDRETYLINSGLSWKTSEDWRLLMRFDAVTSQSDQSDLLNADYAEATIGYAYRPVSNERLNALARYTYLYDLPGPDQVNLNGSLMGPAQRSHIFSADANYDLSPSVTLGVKYAFRVGETSTTRLAEDFTKSSAHLGVVRLDVEFMRDWDVLLEARAMRLPEVDTTDFGLLAAVYRDLGDHIKVGVGYNFGRFSDDLRDQTYDDRGFFVNFVARY